MVTKSVNNKTPCCSQYSEDSMAFFLTLAVVVTIVMTVMISVMVMMWVIGPDSHNNLR